MPWSGRWHRSCSTPPSALEFCSSYIEGEGRGSIVRRLANIVRVSLLVKGRGRPRSRLRDEGCGDGRTEPVWT